MARMLFDIVASNLLVNMFVLVCCVRLNLLVCAQLVYTCLGQLSLFLLLVCTQMEE
jgi:hypothetical protein